MPCDTIRTTSVKLENTDTDVLMATLEEMQLSPSLNYNKTYITFGYGGQEYVDIANKRVNLARGRDVKELQTAIMRNAVKMRVTKVGFVVEEVQQKTEQRARLRLF